MPKFLIISVFLKALYFIVFISLSKFVSPTLAATIEMYYSTSRSISNVSSLGVGVYILKHGVKIKEITLHVFFQLLFVFSLYHVFLGFDGRDFYVHTIPFLIVLGPYLYYANVGVNSIMSSFLKEFHTYPLLLFFFILFFLDVNYDESDILNFSFLIFVSFIIIAFFKCYPRINFLRVRSSLNGLMVIYKDSFIYLYSSLYLMIMNLDRLLFTYIFGEENSHVYFSFIVLLLPVTLVVQMIEDYCIAKNILVKIDFSKILVSLVLFITIFYLLHPVYESVFLFFNLSPVILNVFLCTGLIIFLELWSKVYSVRLYLGDNNHYLKVLGTIMNVILVFFIVFILSHDDLIENDFLYIYLFIHGFKSIVKIYLSYQYDRSFLSKT